MEDSTPLNAPTTNTRLLAEPNSRTEDNSIVPNILVNNLRVRTSSDHWDELSAFSTEDSNRHSGGHSDSLDEWMFDGVSPRSRGRSRIRGSSGAFLLRSTNKSKNARPISWMAICFITYFNVCGGPWGSEEIISTAGPLYGMIGIAVFGLFWAAPMALITSEMSSCYPDDGGYSIWVAEAFGPFWGFQEAWWSWISGVVDTACYPVLALDSLLRILNFSDVGDNPDDDSNPSGWRIYLAKVALVVLFTMPNFCKTGLFGQWMTFLMGFVFLPFLVQIVWLFVFRSGDMDWSRLLDTKTETSSGDLAQLISVLYWNFSGFDSSSTCAGEVREPGKSYPRGLITALMLTTLTYVMPLAVFTSVDEPCWEVWNEGSFSKIAQVQVGQWMAVWIVISSFAANTGMYTAEVFEDSWNLCGMARMGLMPAVFGRRWNGDSGPPYVALSLAFISIVFLVSLNFKEIVYITNLFSCISALLELSAFLKLRQVGPDMHRPYKVPVHSTSAVCIFLLLPYSLGLFICCCSLFASWNSVGINSVVLVLGVLTFYYQQRQGHIQYSRSNLD